MNNGYPFPPMPGQPGTPSTQANAFGQYAYMGQQQNPQQRQNEMRDQLAKQIMGTPATSVAGGAGQMIAGAGMGLRGLADYQKQGQQFPTAPGGAAPSFGTQIANFFTGRQNGGLF